MPFASSDSRTVWTGLIARSFGSANTSAVRTPRSFRSDPTSRVTPAPNRMFETAISKAVSLFIEGIMQRGPALARSSIRKGVSVLTRHFPKPYDPRLWNFVVAATYIFGPAAHTSAQTNLEDSARARRV